jgi:hypothetical protein
MPGNIKMCKVCSIILFRVPSVCQTYSVAHRTIGTGQMQLTPALALCNVPNFTPTLESLEPFLLLSVSISTEECRQQGPRTWDTNVGNITGEVMTVHYHLTRRSRNERIFIYCAMISVETVLIYAVAWDHVLAWGSYSLSRVEVT